MDSLQDRYYADGQCFGCGPANAEGLRIKSFPSDDGTVRCDWSPGTHHEAFEGVLNGGIIGTLLDCHSLITAVNHYLTEGHDPPPQMVTSGFDIRLRRPTPSGRQVHITAEVTEVDGDRLVVESQLLSGEDVCATGRTYCVVIDEGHPAHRER